MDVLFAFVAVLLGFLLGKTEEKTKSKFIYFVTIFFPFSELVKQIILYISNGFYEWWYFPFQLCSIPLYLLPLRCLVKHKNIREYTDSFIVIYGLLAGFIVFCDTSGFVYSNNLLTVHSYLWHILMVVTALVIYSSADCSISFSKGASVYTLCAVMATLFNSVFRPLGPIDMFYISPYTHMNQIVFKNIDIAFGTLPAKAAYIFMTNIGAFVVYCVLKRFKTSVNTQKNKV